MGFSSVKSVDLIQSNLKSVSIFGYYYFLGKNILGTVHYFYGGGAVEYGGGS